MGIPITPVGYGYPLAGLPQERGPFTGIHHATGTEGQETVPPSTTALLGSTGTTKRIEETAQELERISLAFNKKLRFVIDHKTEEVIVKVIDAQTDKVIKELPPEELQRLHQRIKETLGILFDQTV